MSMLSLFGKRRALVAELPSEDAGRLSVGKIRGGSTPGNRAKAVEEVDDVRSRSKEREVEAQLPAPAQESVKGIDEKAGVPALVRLSLSEAGKTGEEISGTNEGIKEGRKATKSDEATPFDELKPTSDEEQEAMSRDDSGWAQTLALLRYMTCTEVHTYAFSVAANVILALFPFIVLMLTLAQQVFHSPAMVVVVGELMRSLLPTSQDFVMRNMLILAHPRKGTQLFSLGMLLITSTGVFLPLEVALNSVWGVKKNRNYLGNQLVALGLAVGVGVLVMASVALTAGQKSVMTLIFFGHTDNFVFYFLANGMMKFCAVIASILLFFLIYWILPNRKVPAMAVLPTAIVVGLSWEVAKYLYVLALPKLDFEAVYGPFRVSVGLMMWAFLSGLLLLAGAHVSATRYTLRLAREAAE